MRVVGGRTRMTFLHQCAADLCPRGSSAGKWLIAIDSIPIGAKICLAASHEVAEPNLFGYACRGRGPGQHVNNWQVVRRTDERVPRLSHTARTAIATGLFGGYPPPPPRDPCRTQGRWGKWSLQPRALDRAGLPSPSPGLGSAYTIINRDFLDAQF